MFRRLFLAALCIFSATVFAKAGDPFCADQVTATPAWANRLKANHRAGVGRGHFLEFHYESIRPRFLNIECSEGRACAEHLLQEIKRKEPAFSSPTPALPVILGETLKLAEDSNWALAVTWNREKDSTWSVRLSLDIPPAGKQVLQSEAVEIQEQLRIERIDVVVKANQTDVSTLNISAIEVGENVVSAESGSQTAMVVLGADQAVPVIDTGYLRPEFLHGPMASPALHRAIDTALILIRAQRPDADKVVLSGRRGVLAEHFNGRWIWPAKN